MTIAQPSSHFRRKLCIAAVLLAVFTVTGFFVVPPVLKSQLEKRISAQLGRTVTLGKVRCNPYSLSLTLEDFDIRLKDGNGSFLGWSRLYVNFDALASMTGDWVLSEVELDGFHATTVIKADGSLNFSDILARLTPPAVAAPHAKPGRPVRVGSFKVTQARVEFSDQSRPAPFATVMGPLTFSLTEFRTAGAKGAPYHFEAVSESGEKLAWTGTISAEPFRSVGELNVENIVLAKYAPYYADRMQADIVEGKLSVRGGYEINLTEGQRALKLLDGALQLRELKVVERVSKEVAVALPALDIIGVNADVLAQKASVGLVGLSGGHLRVRREKDGALNLGAMFSPAGSVSATVAGAPNSGAVAVPAKLPEVVIGEIGLKDFQVDVADLAAPHAAQLGLTGIQFSIKNVSLAEGAMMPLQLSLSWAPQGTVKVEGSVAIKPEMKAELKADVTGLELLPLSPYLEKFVNARLMQGAVTTSLTVQMALPADQPLAATVEGEVKVEKFGLVDGAHSEDLAGVGVLGLKGLKLSTTPQLKVAIDELNLAVPYARIIVNADKSLNLATVARTGEKPPAEAVASPAPPASTPSAPNIAIGRVMISEGDFSLADHSVEPNVRMTINQFGGTITGLSSENMAKAAVDLKAMVDGAGPVAITGQLDPLGASKFVDLKIDFRNVDLLPLSPYSGKYAGYELARGKLLLDVKFLLDGKKISASNVITLNQFAFGNASNSPDATNLPVRLGVALLKDIDGKIVIDVPIQGSTDDPNFQIGKVVWRVIGNLLTKTAVSPFSLLGSMFGGGGDELGYQEFSPGLSALQPAETKKLETMVKALANRPGLSVAIEGSYDGPADGFVLKQQKFAEMVRRAIWEQKHAAQPAIPPPEQLLITPQENLAMVKQLFAAKFPAGTQFDAPLAKAPVAAAAPREAKKGFFGRVMDVVTFKNRRNHKSTPAESAKPAEVKYAEGTVAGGPAVDEMTGRMAETMELGDNDLRALAAARAQQVRDYFISVGKIDAERVFLAKDQADPVSKTGRGPRVFLNLQ